MNGFLTGRGSLAVCLTVLLLTGCSTTGTITNSSSIVAPQTFELVQPLPETLMSYEAEFVSVLERYGLRQGVTDDPNALRLFVHFNSNPFNMKVTLTVWQFEEVVATGMARNPGMGTVIAKHAAIRDLAIGAATELNAQLYALGDRLVVETDSNSNQDTATPTQGDDLYSELLKLEDLRQRGIITDEEFEVQKQRILARPNLK